jgi:predicted chitinase
MRNYGIKWGDTLSALARRFHTSVSELAKANGISNPDRIFAGKTLQIPDGYDGSADEGDGGGQSGGSGPVTGAPGVDTATGPVKGGISAQQLKALMPELSEAQVQKYLPSLNKAMVEGGINTPQRQAAFLAQLAHESGGLKYFEELANGQAYEGRSDLGNTQPGDGARYKGRGPIQLTGRANYAAAGKALGIDLINHPELAATPEVGFKVATWFWNTRNLSNLADTGSFDAITKRVNGGFNGKASRDAYYQKALQVLGG